MDNYKIYSVKDANELVSKYNINQIIITISNLSFHDRKKIIYLLASFKTNSILSCPQKILLFETNVGAPKIPFS